MKIVQIPNLFDKRSPTQRKNTRLITYAVWTLNIGDFNETNSKFIW